MDPGGGGLRSAYASQILVPEELAMRPAAAPGTAAIDPQLNDRISAGLDLRTLLRYTPEDGREAENNFFQMQGDLYLHFQMDDRFSAAFERGLSGSEQVYGTGFVLPAGGYVKLGRFTPAYGWLFSDHTAYVRQELGLSPPADSDVGLELGLFPGNLSLSAGVFNGVPPGQLRDGDDRFILAGRAEWRQRLGPVNAGLGASWRRNDEDPEAQRSAGGPFAYWSWGPVTWLGEWDFFDRPAPDGSTNALATSHELTWSFVQGLYLRGSYDFLDPDLDLATGSWSRVGVGVDALVTPFAGVMLMANFQRFDEGEAVTGENYAQAVMVLHLLY
jgi:hypothetical protein